MKTITVTDQVTLTLPNKVRDPTTTHIVPLKVIIRPHHGLLGLAAELLPALILGELGHGFHDLAALSPYRSIS